MSTWLCRTPTRLEILHLIQQHNTLDPTRSQPIPVFLSPNENVKLEKYQQEQKLRKRNFTPLQLSAYSLQRCIEDVLKHDASTSDCSYDGETCLAATKDFLSKLEVEMEAIESLKMAAEKAKILEKQKEVEVTTVELCGTASTEKMEEHQPSMESAARRASKETNQREDEESEDDLFIYIKTIIARAERRKVEQRRQARLSARKVSTKYDANRHFYGKSSVVMTRAHILAEEEAVARRHQVESSGSWEDIISVSDSIPTDQKPITSRAFAPPKTVKSILKKCSSLPNLRDSGEPFQNTQTPESSREALGSSLNDETCGGKRDIIAEILLQKAYERGLTLSAEVNGFE